MAEHCVKLIIPLSESEHGSPKEREELFELEDRLIEAIDEKGVGEFDGNEFGDGKCWLFMYGPDADALYAAIEPIVKTSRHCQQATVYKRYGDVGDKNAKEVEFMV